MSPDGLCVIKDPGLSPSLRDLARDVAVGRPRCHQDGGTACAAWKPGGSVCVPTKTRAMMPRKRFPWLLLSVTIPKCLTRSSNVLLGQACLNPIFQSFRLTFPDVLERAALPRSQRRGARCSPSRDHPSSPPGSKMGHP